MNARGWIILVIIVILAGAVVLYWTRDHTGIASAPRTTEAPQTVQARFNCDNGRYIDATFISVTHATTTGNSVGLSLSDGRSLTLPQAISADGGRHANADESVVFWNVGNDATFTENGTSTYLNCSTQ